LFITGIAVGLWGLHIFGWMKTWTLLQVPAMYPPFADLRTVQGALTSIARGFDPQITNPGDPWSRPMNYPMVWIKIAKTFDFTRENNYLLFVSSYAIAYLACVCNLLRKFPSFWMLAAFFSGSSLLAIERGNNDLLIFVLLYLSATISIVWISALVIMFGFVLKIYPIFAALSLLKDRIAFSLLLLASTVLLLFHFSEVGRIKAATPVYTTLGYGVPSVAAALSRRTGISPILLGTILLAFVLVFFLSGLFRHSFASDEVPEEAVRLFLVGGGVYVATFLISSNWDYRLIFIVLCIPYLLHLKSKCIMNVLLVLVLVSSNYSILVRLLGLRLGWEVTVLSKTALFIVFSAFLIREVLSLFPTSACAKLAFSRNNSGQL
jgi:hypothetical protein